MTTRIHALLALALLALAAQQAQAQINPFRPADKLLAETAKVKPGEAQGFNPQPEPPGDASKGLVKPGTLQGFNPQPDPPIAKGASKSAQ